MLGMSKSKPESKSPACMRPTRPMRSRRLARQHPPPLAARTFEYRHTRQGVDSRRRRRRRRCRVVAAGFSAGCIGALEAAALLAAEAHVALRAAVSGRAVKHQRLAVRLPRRLCRCARPAHRPGAAEGGGGGGGAFRVRHCASGHELGIDRLSRCSCSSRPHSSRPSPDPHSRTRSSTPPHPHSAPPRSPRCRRT